MAVLAVVLALCSEADAFVAASLTAVPLTARLVFLVVGPAVDVKLIALQAGTFGRSFALRFAPATLAVAVLCATATGLLLLGDAMNRQTQHVLLALLGGALLRIAADDTFLRYVRPGHRPLLVAAGVVMVVLAGVGVLRDLRRERAVDPHEHGSHGSGGAERIAPWLLLLPVLAMAVVAPPALGADAVARAGPVDGTAITLPPLPPGPVVELGVGEFVQRAVWDTGATLDGREVVLTGFAVPRAGGVELARLTIMCCAADARVHRVRMAGPRSGSTVWRPTPGCGCRAGCGPGRVPRTGYPRSMSMSSTGWRRPAIPTNTDPHCRASDHVR